MNKEVSIRLYKHSGTKWKLPFFILKAPLKLLSWRLSGVRTIHLHDASLCILMWPWTYIFRKVTCTVNGLDAVYPNPVYQLLLRLCRKKIDLFLPISESTMQSCIQLGFDEAKLKFMPDGIYPNSMEKTAGKQELRAILGEEFKIENCSPFIVLWVGRMIPRKGLLWFLKHVAPSLNSEIAIWIVGTGQQATEAREVADTLGLRTHFFGNVSDQKLLEIRLASDLFIMPNVHVEGDKEGFGLVSLEANDASLWVLAADIDGIPSAVHDGKNGHLIEAENSTAWIQALNELSGMPKEKLGQLGSSAKAYALKNFSWNELAKRWRQEVFE